MAFGTWIWTETFQRWPLIFLLLGIGYGICVIACFTGFYYNTIIAWYGYKSDLSAWYGWKRDLSTWYGMVWCDLSFLVVHQWKLSNLTWKSLNHQNNSLSVMFGDRSLYYLVLSLTTKTWGECGNEWNTEKCYDMNKFYQGKFDLWVFFNASTLIQVQHASLDFSSLRWKDRTTKKRTENFTSNGGCRREEKSRKHWSFFTKLLSLVTANLFFY